MNRDSGTVWTSLALANDTAHRSTPASACSGTCVAAGPAVPVTTTTVTLDSRCRNTFAVSTTAGCLLTGAGNRTSHTSPRSGSAASPYREGVTSRRLAKIPESLSSWGRVTYAASNQSAASPKRWPCNLTETVALQYVVGVPHSHAIRLNLYEPPPYVPALPRSGIKDDSDAVGALDQHPR